MKLLSVALLSVVALTAASTINRNDSTNSDDKVVQDTLKREKRSIGVDENYKKEVEIKTKLGTSIKISKAISYNDGGAVAHLPMLVESLANKDTRVINALHHHHGHGINDIHGVSGGQVGGEIGITTGGDIGAGSHVDVIGGDVGFGAGGGGGGQIGIDGQVGTGGQIGIGGQVGTGDQIGIGGQVGTGGQIGIGGQVSTGGQITSGSQINGASHIVIIGGTLVPSGGQVSIDANGHHGLHADHHAGLSRLHSLAELIHYRHGLKKQHLHEALHSHHGLLTGQGVGHHSGALKSLLLAKHALLAEKVSRKLIALSANKPIGPPCCPSGPCCPGNQG